MAISTTLAVNVSATLSYGSLTLATATKTSSATCLNTAGAKFEDGPTLTATALKTYFGNAGAVDQSKKYVLYVENFDTAADVIVVPLPNAPKLNATGLDWKLSSSVSYVAHEVVNDDGVYYRCILAHTSGATRPAGDATNWVALEIPTFNTALAWDVGTAYVAKNLVKDNGSYYINISSVTGGAVPGLQPTKFRPYPQPDVVPYGRPLCKWTVGGFQLIMSAAPTTTGLVKVICVADEA